jgi:GntR family transcriptional regulator
MKYKALEELGEVSKRRGIAYYHQVYTLLAMALADGSIAAGSALPSETELMEHFDVSRNTVRRALGQLEAEKRIVRRRGSGSYARAVPATSFTPEAIAEVIHDGDSAKSLTASRLLRVHNGPTPEFLRRRDPQFGDVSMMVQRCRSYKEIPFLLTTSFVPDALARRLTRRHLSQSTVLVALNSIGIVPASAEQTTTAVAADSVTARHLGVDTSAALLCVHRLIRDGSGRPMEHQSHFYRPDRCHVQARLSIDSSGGDLRWQTAKAPPIPAWL